MEQKMSQEELAELMGGIVSLILLLFRIFRKEN